MLTWRRVDGNGHSMSRVERSPTGWVCQAVEVIADPGDPIACSFSVELDPDWVTRAVEVTAISRIGTNHVVLRTDEHRDWWRNDDLATELAGCVDVDIAATPLTNTFPIRRLAGLPVDQERTSPVAWVEVPGLQVIRVEQTYRRLGINRWRYSDPRHGAFELSVDEQGFVTSYEGFARRVEHGTN